MILLRKKMFDFTSPITEANVKAPAVTPAADDTAFEDAVTQRMVGMHTDVRDGVDRAD
jgi:hypothetical protein